MKLRDLVRRLDALTSRPVWLVHLEQRRAINAKLEEMLANPGAFPPLRQSEPGELARWREREPAIAAALERMLAAALAGVPEPSERESVEPQGSGD